MTDCESLSTAGHRITIPVLTVSTKFVRFVNVCAASLKLKNERPCRHDAPPEVSPSTKTSLVPSGEKAGTIIAVVPRPHEVGPVTSTGDPPTTVGSSRIE